jgi:hypothetical protein
MYDLELRFETDEDGSLVLVPTLTNTGDQKAEFSTASSLLFDIHVETPDGERVWSDCGMATQAFQYHSLAPGESLSQGALWESRDAHAESYESYNSLTDDELSLDEYCERFGLTDWREYEGEELIAVVNPLGPPDVDSKQFPFTVSDDLLSN